MSGSKSGGVSRPPPSHRTGTSRRRRAKRGRAYQAAGCQLLPLPPSWAPLLPPPAATSRHWTSGRHLQSDGVGRKLRCDSAPTRLMTRRLLRGRCCDFLSVAVQRRRAARQGRKQQRRARRQTWLACACKSHARNSSSTQLSIDFNLLSRPRHHLLTFPVPPPNFSCTASHMSSTPAGRDEDLEATRG